MHAWLQVELTHPGLVQTVIIINRKDCCGDRLKSVEVRVGPNEATKTGESHILRNSLCGRYSGPGSNGEIVNITCSAAIEGKYVTVQIMENIQVNFAEVEVFGYSKGK